MQYENPTVWTDEDARRSRELNDTFTKNVWIPRLTITVHSIELEIGCAALIEAEVTATLRASEIISTGAQVLRPEHSIWSLHWTLKGPFKSFSRQAIEISELILKEFVNDWTASQTLP
jgi:hypothetical protein